MKKKWQRSVINGVGTGFDKSSKLIKLTWKYRWFSLLTGLVLYFVYQYTFIIPTLYAEPLDNKLPKNKTVFLTIKEHRYGLHHDGFSSLTEELKTWKKENDKILFRYPSMLPSEDAKVVVIYDRGLDSFEQYSTPFTVSSLPYTFYFQDKPYVTINKVSSKGTAELEFNGKKIIISANDTYSSWSYDRFQAVQVEIQNQGLVPINTFDLFPETKKKIEREKEKLKQK
ncbi:hypothetical protein bcgnr5378_29200 [Bacillus cereus]